MHLRLLTTAQGVKTNLKRRATAAFSSFVSSRQLSLATQLNREKARKVINGYCRSCIHHCDSERIVCADLSSSTELHGSVSAD